MTFVPVDQTIECIADTDTKDLEYCECCDYFKGFQGGDQTSGAIRCGWIEGATLPEDLGG